MRRTIYCVQCFKLSGAELQTGALRQYTSATEAEAVTALLRTRVDGLVFYAVEGDPEAGIWGEPEVYERHGAAPEG